MLKNGPFIIATLLVKNEEDIIEHTLTHHINQENIDFIIATNNNSKDNTKNILKKFKEVKVIIDETGTDHNQSAWVTRMANIAMKYQPKWIVHLDADEFWCNLHLLKNYSKEIKYLKINKIYNHICLDKTFSFESTKFYCKQEELINIGIANTPAKIIHKPVGNFIIENGNHNLITDPKMHPIYDDEILIHHYPVRSYKQFERKVKDGAESLIKLGLSGVGQHWINWYELYKNNELEQEYDKFITNGFNFIKSNEPNTWIPFHEFFNLI